MMRRLLASLVFATGLPALAAEVNVIGLFPGKAVIVVNRGAPRTLSVGQRSPEGVLLVSVDAKGAVLEIDGKRQSLEMGQHFESAEQSGSRNSVTLAPDSRGHFIADGAVNGSPVRFLVDTGATTVAISAGEAKRLGIDYLNGQRGFSQTANGVVPVYRVRLDSVTVGDITLRQVEGLVLESEMGVALLGMSFLNRTEMRREGSSMTLTKRF